MTTQESVVEQIKPTQIETQASITQKEKLEDASRSLSAQESETIKEKQKLVRLRGPKKIPQIIKEKLKDYDDERILTIHFSPKILKKAPRWRRARKAAKYVREFVLRYVKYVNYSGGEEPAAKKLRILEPRVWISPEINEILWRNGAENPPKRIRVQVLIKVDEDGIIKDPEGKPIGCSAEIRVFPLESKYITE